MANLPDEVRIKNNPGRAGIDGIRVRGGFFGVATTAERYGLDDDVRRKGMQVYDEESGSTWRLLTNGPWNYDTSDWEEVPGGGGLPFPGTDRELAHFWKTAFTGGNLPILLEDLLLADPKLFVVNFATAPGQIHNLTLCWPPGGTLYEAYLIVNTGDGELAVSPTPGGAQIDDSDLPAIVMPRSSTFFRHLGNGIYYTHRLVPLAGVSARVATTFTNVPRVSCDFFCDLSGGPFTMLLHVTPLIGQRHTLKDMNGNAGTNNLTIDGNGLDIEQFTGGTASTLVFDQDGDSATLQFNGTFWNLV